MSFEQYFNRVSAWEGKAEFLEGDSHVGRGSVSASVQEGDGVGEVVLRHWRDGAGPDFNATFLQCKTTQLFI
jgi:hypothetical protein